MVMMRPELRGTFGAVSSTHWLASAAGMAVLESGGNAFDAAVAAGFVLQVVEPHLNGPGGDVPILGFDAGSGHVRVVCGQGPMPLAATPAAFQDLGLARIPGSGLLPATVPGAFGAWLKLLEEHGTLRLEQVMAYAIGYASDGYPLLPKAAAAIGVLAPLFREEWAESGRTYLVNGAPPPPGSRMLQAHSHVGGQRALLRVAPVVVVGAGGGPVVQDRNSRTPSMALATLRL